MVVVSITMVIVSVTIAIIMTSISKSPLPTIPVKERNNEKYDFQNHLFNNILVMLWWSVLLVEETGVS
jgi:hypothetical protein